MLSMIHVADDPVFEFKNRHPSTKILSWVKLSIDEADENTIARIPVSLVNFKLPCVIVFTDVKLISAVNLIVENAGISINAWTD